MTTLLTLSSLLAEIGDNFPQSGPRRSWSDLGAYGIAAVIVAIAAAVAAQLRKRNDMSEHCDKPWKLFRELCQVHGLDRQSQRLLAQLARERRLAQPAEVFLWSQGFAPEGLPPALQHHAARLERLRQQLFE
ncbi:MAG: hypothetical protein DCC67_12875 [Planctomycetota bacterium]|nr:MAG: hypothetical protein DCC67_12875 [Planctomycetota bacterium]